MNKKKGNTMTPRLIFLKFKNAAKWEEKILRDIE